jgi:hypothetical protein
LVGGYIGFGTFTAPSSLTESRTVFTWLGTCQEASPAAGVGFFAPAFLRIDHMPLRKIVQIQPVSLNRSECFRKNAMSL